MDRIIAWLSAFLIDAVLVGTFVAVAALRGRRALSTFAVRSGDPVARVQATARRNG